MDSFSRAELEFVVRTIENKVRLDTRELMEKRIQVLVEQDVPRADRSIKITRGLSEIDLNISFKSSRKTLAHLKLMEDGIDGGFMDRFFYRSEAIGTFVRDQHQSSEDFQTLQTKLKCPNPVFTRMEDFLDQLKIGVLMEVVVIRDDGNVFDMIFDGIRYAFSDIIVPDINSLSKEKRTGVSLPWSTSFAVFEDLFVADPVLLEEHSACGIVHVFKDADQKISVFTEFPIELEMLRKVLACIE